MSTALGNHPVFYSDLEMLRCLLTPEYSTLKVYDPHGRITGAKVCGLEIVRDQPYDEYYFDLCGYGPNGHACSLYFGSGTDNFTNWCYINNNDGTMRWVYPVLNSAPAFLSLYNATSLKARAFKLLTRFAWTIGRGNVLAHGNILLDESLIQSLYKHCGINSKEEISFFTGTRGATRKIVVEINNGRTVNGFIKIPAGPIAVNNIQNENNMLNSLRKYDFTSLSIPTLSLKVNGHARLSNVKPSIVIPADKINTIHLRAMSELYSFNHSECKVEDSTAWEVIHSHMEFLKSELTFTNGLPEVKTRQIIRLLRKLYNSIPTNNKISVSISHGDFTPWNMYCDEQRLFVYDWEMANSGMPMLFDLYHFTFQSNILSRNKTYTEVVDGIRQWQENPLAKQIIEKYKIDTALHYRLYLLFTIGYYIRQYIGEKELLMQSHWMLNAWTSALESMIPMQKVSHK